MEPLMRFPSLNPKSDPSPRPSPLRKGRREIVGSSLSNRGSWEQNSTACHPLGWTSA